MAFLALLSRVASLDPSPPPDGSESATRTDPRHDFTNSRSRTPRPASGTRSATDTPPHTTRPASGTPLPTPTPSFSRPSDAFKQSNSFAQLYLTVSRAGAALSGGSSAGLVVGVVTGVFVVVVSAVIVMAVILSRRKTPDVDQSESDDGPVGTGLVSQTCSDTVTTTQIESVIRDGGQLMQPFPTVSFSVDTPIIGFY
jgi:hypothetical protein